MTVGKGLVKHRAGQRCQRHMGKTVGRFEQTRELRDLDEVRTVGLPVPSAEAAAPPSIVWTRVPGLRRDHRG